MNDFEKDVEGALKVMEKVAKKARPREDAAELIRKIRSGDSKPCI